MLDNKRKKITLTFFAIILVFLFIILISSISLQNDTLFDIKLGEKYLNEGVNSIDKFSIHEGLDYISHHFLVNIITYLLYNSFGFIGLYCLEIVLVVILAILFYVANNIFLKNKKLSYLFLFIELLFITPYISVRAQMYSYIFFILEIICIEKFLKDKKFSYLILLSILPLFIINFHAGTIFFYFIIIGVYLLNYIPVNIFKIQNDIDRNKKLKYLFIPIVIGSLLMFINPFGVESVIYSFKTLGNSFINENIAEFQPASIGNCLIAYIYIFIYINVYFFTNRKVKLHQILLLYGTIFMTLLSIRHFSLLVIVSVTSVEHLADVVKSIYFFTINGIKKEKIKSINNMLICVYLIVIFCVGFYFSKPYEIKFLPENIYPLKAMDYINNNIPESARIFNEYSWGSLMMLNDRKVFIDSRADLYTSEYNNGTTVAIDYINAIQCKKDYNEILKRYNIDYLFISTNSPLYYNVENNLNYNIMYKDENSAIIKVNI